jgi:hypothetical protein
MLPNVLASRTSSTLMVAYALRCQQPPQSQSAMSLPDDRKTCTPGKANDSTETQLSRHGLRHINIASRCARMDQAHQQT